MSGSGFLFVVIAAGMTTAANLLLRAGITQAGGFRPDGAVAVVFGFARLLLEPFFAAGFILYFLAALVWFRVVSSELLSTAYPVMVGFVFFMVSLGGIILFREPVSVRKAIGLAVILVGIAIASTARSAQIR
jgi:multidrug transporter EmrE-like cation transporter